MIDHNGNNFDALRVRFPNLTDERIEALREAFLSGLPPGGHLLKETGPLFSEVCAWADGAYKEAAILAGIERGELALRIEDGAIKIGERP
jgi:hypothetical protein